MIDPAFGNATVAAPARHRFRRGLRALTNGLLASASLVVALAVFELTARALLPHYDQLANPPRRHYPSAVTWPHRDTGIHHQVAYNNLGGRQHRNFNDAELRTGVNIAVFGDSYTENRRMAVPYSFTEPLDHLLNAIRGERGEHGTARINVLNFGISGTGPGAQFLVYRRTPHRERFAHVFYVHCENDFRNLRLSDRWALDAAGNLVGRPAKQTAAWVRVSSGLHLTYLGLDAWHRLVGGDVPAANQQDDAVFRAVVLRWQREVEANGGSFHVAPLPSPGTGARFAAVGWPASLDILDLTACFKALDPGGSWSDWKFVNGPHWNEYGNMLAAHCLLRHLAPRLELGTVDDAVLKAETSAYYQAFTDDQRWPGQRWTPRGGGGGGGGTHAATVRRVNEGAAIVARHLALDDDFIDGLAQQPMAMARARQAPARRVGGGWRVHASAPERLLVYVKDPCTEADPAKRLFAHAHPARPEDLNPVYRTQAFADLRRREQTVWRTGEECAVAMALPRFPVARVVTGEHRPGGDVLWREEFPLEAPDTLADYRREYQRLATAEPFARAGGWRIHVGDGEPAHLLLTKAPCSPRDRRRLFLRVLPATARSDIPRVEEGFVPWISKTHRNLERAPTETPIRRWYANHVVSALDDQCLIKAWLPEWPVATVWAGHFSGEDGRQEIVWEVKLHLDTQRFERALRHASVGEPGGAWPLQRLLDPHSGRCPCRNLHPANPARPKMCEHGFSCIG